MSFWTRLRDFFRLFIPVAKKVATEELRKAAINQLRAKVSPERGKELAELAAKKRNMNPLKEQMAMYEDELYHFLRESEDANGEKVSWFTTELEQPEGVALIDATVTHGDADACAIGSHALTVASLKFHLGEHSPQLMQAAFSFVEACCDIGEPGLVVRSFLPIDLEYKRRHREGTKDQWFQGMGRYMDFVGRDDASPPQVVSIVTALGYCWAYGPKRYRARSSELVASIYARLKRDKFKLKNRHGEPTRVPDLDIDPGTLIVGAEPALKYLHAKIFSRPPFNIVFDELSLSLFADQTISTDAGVFLDPETGEVSSTSPGGRALEMLVITRIAAAVTGDAEIIADYGRLIERGYHTRARDSITSIYGMVDMGQELPKAERLAVLFDKKFRIPTDAPEARVAFDILMWKLYDLTERNSWGDPLFTVAASWFYRDPSVVSSSDALRVISQSVTPRRGGELKNSARTDIELLDVPSLDLEPLAVRPLPRYEWPPNAWAGSRDPRKLDGNKDKERRWSHLWELHAYYMLKSRGLIT